MVSTIRKSFRRRLRPDPLSTEFETELMRFQTNSRRRESLRIRQAPRIFDQQEQLIKEMQAEERISLGTEKLLAAAKDKIQRLQAAKALLLSTARQEALGLQLKRLRQGEAPSRENRDPGRLGEVSLSDIRIPLRWSPDAVINDAGDKREFALFAVVSCGTQIYDTVLACPVDCRTTDLVFPEAILMSQVGPDFQLKIDLYSHGLPAPGQSTSKSLLRTLKARLRGKKEAQLADQNIPLFHHTATAVLAIGEASTNEQCCQLAITEAAEEAVRSNNVPPLFGEFCFRLAVRPYYHSLEPTVHSGKLSMAWSGSEIVLADCEARLSSCHLRVWSSRAELEAGSRPWHQIPIAATSQATAEPARLAFTLTDSAMKNREQAEFICSSLTELESWMAALEESIQDNRLWKQAASTKMEIFSPSCAVSPTVGRRSKIQKTRSRLLSMYNKISAVNIGPLNPVEPCVRICE